MKTLKFTLIVLLVTTAFAASTQTQVKSDVKIYLEFQQNVEKWKEAYNSKDGQNLLPLYAEDAVYSSSHVAGLEAIGRDRVIANFQVGMSGGGHIDKIEILSANIYGELASLYCLYQATNSGVTVTGRNLLVLRKVKNQWMIINHMTVV